MADRRVTHPILEVQQKIIRDKLSKIKYKILVLSCKGGVGKSFISASISLLLALRGKHVGIFDADLHGPSIPLILGIRDKHVLGDSEGNLIPVNGPHNIKVISLTFLMSDPTKPLVWRGPLKTRALMELLMKTKWNDINYLIFDLPPGTGDEALTLVQSIPNITGALIVTVPSLVSEAIVLKAMNFCEELGIKILGVVENMAYYTCPENNKNYPLFKISSRESLLKDKAKLLVSLPFDPRVTEAIDKGEYPEFIKNANIPLVSELNRLVDEIIKYIEVM